MSVVEAMVAVSARAGLPVWIPPDVAGNCCAVPWGSKGYGEGHAWMANKMVDRLWRWTDEGELHGRDRRQLLHPRDHERARRCAERGERRAAREARGHRRHRLGARPAAAESERREGRRSVAVHPTCSGRHLGIDRRLRKLSAELSDDVFVPPSAACCGFAGDRGFLHPELTASATQEEAAEVKGRTFDAHVSTNRTCEIGMERATGRPYVHVVQLLEQLSR